MSRKICQIRVISINGQIVVARKDASDADIKRWFERGVEEISRVERVSLTDKLPMSEKTVSQLIEETDFEPEDLPTILC